MGKRVMHIGERRWLLGGVRTLCGRVLHEGDGYEGDPLCPQCYRKSDWSADFARKRGWR